MVAFHLEVSTATAVNARGYARTGGMMQMIQLWVNLRAKDKDRAEAIESGMQEKRKEFLKKSIADPF